MNQEEYKKLLDYLNKHHAHLVAVSKTRSIEQLMPLYQYGQRTFGENRVQELLQKVNQLPDDVQWHMIGHLQTNKVKQIAAFVALIHSVDSFKLLREINKQAKNNDRIINCLLQFKIANEETKYGFSKQEALEMLASKEFSALNHINIVGVMGMATFTHDKSVVKQEFTTLKTIFDQLKADVFNDHPDFKEISMGMSGDYQLAIEQGSTIVRIGSLLF